MSFSKPVSLNLQHIQSHTQAWDVDAASRPVMALKAQNDVRAWEYMPHAHRQGQLIYTVRGIVKCEVEEGIWIVPPQCAVWIPPDKAHSARGMGPTECYCLFVSPDAVADLPVACSTVAVSTLFRELLLKAAGFEEQYDEAGAQGRLIATLLDELVAAPVEDLHLPLPHDARLRKLADLLVADPADKATLAVWAQRIGMSERSLSRQLRQEIGMSFGHWRRQLHVILSLQRLSKGESVQSIAMDLGYENASGFVTMFRKMIGKPPARYVADYHGMRSQVRDTGVVAGIMMWESP